MPVRLYRHPVREFLEWFVFGALGAVVRLSWALRRAARWSVQTGTDLFYGGASRPAPLRVLAVVLGLLVIGLGTLMVADL